jgi:hypothetical protein
MDELRKEIAEIEQNIQYMSGRLAGLKLRADHKQRCIDAYEVGLLESEIDITDGEEMKW